jgi:tRNA threonylcarbamoyladenosine biosynthesis protein TsaB
MGDLIAIHEIKDDKYVHAEKLNLLIQNCISEAQIKYNELSAIAVSSGPGSFTGLRIGVSTAKGLAYSLGIPLISVDSLTSLFQLFKSQNIATNKDIVLPMIDARRQEVYTMASNYKGEQIIPISAQVIDASFFNRFSKDTMLHLIGDGCDKFDGKFNAKNIQFHKTIISSAIGMIESSQNKFIEKNFEDVAYFTPKYVKEFHFN